ncbi:CzcE family metal-binding protein [Oxalobacteraceae bacterium OM1]|nr:CzcE family metal-binding protein [Oxalobacteraceae bacterium OM1]
MKIVFIACIAAALGACATRTSYTDLYGSPAPPDPRQTTIRIDPGTRYVQVEGGQTVRFLVGDQAFAWSFNVARTVHRFDLNSVAPPGLLDHTVTAMVAPDPKYIGPP